MSVDWAKWAAIGQIAGALGTFTAVATSLYLARSTQKPKLTVSAGIRIIVGPGTEAPWPRYVCFEVKNVGLRDVYVDQITSTVGRWPFKHPGWLARGFAVQTFGTVPESLNPPFELKQGRRAVAMLMLENSLDQIRERTGDTPFFPKGWPVLGLRKSPIYVNAHLASGECFTSRAERELEGELHASEVAKFLTQPE